VKLLIKRSNNLNNVFRGITRFNTIEGRGARTGLGLHLMHSFIRKRVKFPSLDGGGERRTYSIRPLRES
jgi:hypothetical protein